MADDEIDANDFLGLGTGESEEPRLHPILTNEEFRQAQATARVKVEADRRKAAMKAVEAEERNRLEREEGLITGDGWKDEIVTITIDLAEHSSRLLVNGTPYWHGFTYNVPRHVANTLAEMQARGWRHQDEIDGQSLTQHYHKKRLTMMNGATGATTNAPVRPDAEVRH